ncbi:Fatty acid-binding -like protein 1 [Echinococcus granulosus]|uniref:Fatty acid binding protein, adipocyte n=1 Tax=Echinococcus granulosus TaxID=6210 RepID=A0A068WTS7_ECHGR|nr:Fatty acid-binding -like protein 1 [Echinococcus granulosus]CDS21089.1 fatty acid binding protein, adipocyte [Echinococcus granulosus]
MEAFLGTWKMEKSEGLEDVMERLKVDMQLRKMATSLKPDLIISDLGDGKYSMRLDSPSIKSECSFKLGEKFKEMTPDKREVSSLITLENGVMKQEQVGEDITVHIERVVEGNELKATGRVDKAVCVLTFTKVA